MAEAFSSDKLRASAWERFQRYVRGESARRMARSPEEQWFRDMLYIKKISSVVEWCEARSMTVVTAKKPNGTYEPDSKVVTIAGRASPEKMLHYLLHECGHHLIGMEEHHERFGKGYPRGGEPRIHKNFQHRLACLEEEMEAWHRGWKLAKRLNLGADRDEYDRTRSECLRSYIAWAAEKKGRKL